LLQEEREYAQLTFMSIWFCLAALTLAIWVQLWLQGQVLIKGKARNGLLADDKELASQLKVGMVFQNGALFDSLNVQENVGFMLYEHSHLPADRIEVWCHYSLPPLLVSF